MLAGGTGWTIQWYIGTLQGDEVAGVAFSSWEVFARRCATIGELGSLFMRQSTVAFG